MSARTLLGDAVTALALGHRRCGTWTGAVAHFRCGACVCAGSYTARVTGLWRRVQP